MNYTTFRFISIIVIIFITIFSIAVTSLGIQQYRSNNEDTANNKTFNFLVVYLIFLIFVLFVCFVMLFHTPQIVPENCLTT